MLNKFALDMCFLVKDEIVKRVSGRVNFRAVDVMNDTDQYVIFKIEFKDFVYEQIVNIDSAAITMSSTEIADHIVRSYRKTVEKTFFKK